MEITGVTYSTSDYEHYNQNGDINYFEEVVDKMILDGISGMNESFRNAIMSLDRDKKRMTILSLLDKDLNLFKRIKALTDKNIGKMDHIKDIIMMLREYVKVGEVEKKKFGEVMTPLELVKEMLATLPEDVWSNPNLKWLDPANGTGPYPIMVIYKLMNGLAEWEPDAEKRYKHIVENMIYVCELQPKNMFLYMCAVDPFDKYKLNVYTGSFLEKEFDYHMKNVWNVTAIVNS
jgi:type I restriction-modification system DNA methylase subunit